MTILLNTKKSSGSKSTFWTVNKIVCVFASSHTPHRHHSLIIVIIWNKIMLHHFNCKLLVRNSFHWHIFISSHISIYLIRHTFWCCIIFHICMGFASFELQPTLSRSSVQFPFQQATSGNPILSLEAGNSSSRLNHATIACCIETVLVVHFNGYLL